MVGRQGRAAFVGLPRVTPLALALVLVAAFAHAGLERALQARSRAARRSSGRR